MNWIEVNAPQIKAIAFEEPSTLGVRFQPAPWQVKKNLPGGEYAYSNVTPRMFQALAAAANQEAYFTTHIKNLPELHPYTKIEAENPSLPFSTSTSTDGVNSEPTVTITALTKVDTLKETEIFVPGTLDPLLEEIRTAVLAEAAKLDVSTEAKRAALKSLAFRVTKSRTFIEGLHKAYTQAEKKRLATVDGEKRRICDILDGIKEEIRRPLTEWEGKEQTRVDGHAAMLDRINKAQPHVFETIADLERAIQILTEVDPDTHEEFAVPIQKAKEATVTALLEDLEKRQKVEDERKELEALRAQLTAQQDEKRKAEAAAEEAKRKAEAAEAEAKRIADAAAAAVEEERKRNAAKAAQEYAEMEARAKDTKNKGRVNGEVLMCLVNTFGLETGTATQIINAIADRRIPHVSITY